MSRALLAVLEPGLLVDFDRTAVIRRAEKTHNIVLRVTQGARELLHEAVSASTMDLAELCSALPRLFAEALRDIRVAEQTLEIWAAIAGGWSERGD